MAFPTTSVIDDFNRADVGPPPSANWASTQALDANTTAHRVVGNQCLKSSGGWHSIWWQASTFGPDTEVFITVSTLPAVDGDEIVFLFARLQGPGATTADGYALYVGYSAASVETWAFYRIDNGSQINIGSATSTAVAAGDSIGFAVVGTQLQAWHKPSAGSWTQVGTVTDATYSTAGNIGFESQNGVSVFDGFGGGTVLAPGQPKRYMWMP
jgi:hypothetical protein